MHIVSLSGVVKVGARSYTRKELASSAVWNLLRFVIGRADLFTTPQNGQPRPGTSRRKAMTHEEIEALKQKVAVTTKPSRPLVFDQPTASGEQI